MSSSMMDRLSLERLPAPVADRILREREENDAIYKTRSESSLDLSNLHYFHARMIQWGIQQLAPSLAGLRVLDIGVGDGQSSVLLARQGAQVTGTEVSSEALDRARRVAARYQVPIDFRQMAGESLEFPDETFDAVLCISAYHHMDQELAAREIARVLRPGGRAVFVEPLAPIHPHGLIGGWFVGLREAQPPTKCPHAFVIWRYCVDIFGRSTGAECFC